MARRLRGADGVPGNHAAPAPGDALLAHLSVSLAQGGFRAVRVPHRGMQGCHLGGCKSPVFASHGLRHRATTLISCKFAEVFCLRA